MNARVVVLVYAVRSHNAPTAHRRDYYARIITHTYWWCAFPFVHVEFIFIGTIFFYSISVLHIRLLHFSWVSDTSYVKYSRWQLLNAIMQSYYNLMLAQRIMYCIRCVRTWVWYSVCVVWWRMLCLYYISAVDIHSNLTYQTRELLQSSPFQIRIHFWNIVLKQQQSLDDSIGIF